MGSSRFAGPLRRPTARDHRHRGGFSVVELMITATIFLVVLGALGSLLVSSTRAYQVNAVRSEALQDSEAVLQLMRYEIGLAGYRGLGADSYDQAFTFGSPQTVVVGRTIAGDDEVTVRYFEDRYLGGGGDTGERAVTFRVDAGTMTLQRVERRPGNLVGTTELLVGNVASMEVLELVGPDRERVSLAAIRGGASPPAALAGLNFVFTFDDGRTWEFMIGLTNPQLFSVTN